MSGTPRTPLPLRIPTIEGTVRYRARWIFPVASPPLEAATIEIVDGHISAIHTQHDLRAIDLGNVALIPGLINAHTHLEFSSLAAPLGPASPFPEWIRSVVTHRNTRTSEIGSLVASGWNESFDSGVTAVGEIATDDRALPAATESGCCGVVFRELLGFSPERIDAQLDIARRHLEAARRHNLPALRGGLSPHAPYSVHPELFDRLVALAIAESAPLAMHLAETRDELEFLSEQTGAFRRMLESFGVWREGVLAPGTRPLDYLKRLADAPRALVVHGNYLSDDEIEFLVRHPQLTVVYCPRTHAYFRHSPHPWREMLQRGIPVALGTDSRASNPDLSLWGELLFLRRSFPDVPPQQLLELATICGARALGCDQSGTLAAGSPAEITCVGLTGDDTDPHRHLLACQNSPD
jgi:cytosine/adenosine deaminase-related metal-dependent hydrolase